MNNVILSATDLDGFLTPDDKQRLKEMNDLYEDAVREFTVLGSSQFMANQEKARKSVIELYNRMGDLMQEIVNSEPAIKVYSFETPWEVHGEASRLIAKLRHIDTGHAEFVYYIQRAYELLFNLCYGASAGNKNHLIIRTPVTVPVQNYAVHKIPNVDDKIENSVMCVMLRGALLPSMIMSKEIQEYSSGGYVTPFALFRIKRDDSKQEHDMEYILDLDKSYFDLKELDGKDLVFADPMNATGGSLVTIVKYLTDEGVKPRSIQFFNVISALKGALRTVRALENVTVYTLWMDPVLNEDAYILPGLGDAGDRLNGTDPDLEPRNIIRLIADYGTNITGLYRSQVKQIEQTVLGR